MSRGPRVKTKCDGWVTNSDSYWRISKGVGVAKGLCLRLGGVADADLEADRCRQQSTPSSRARRMVRYLLDPNTGREIFEAAEIRRYERDATRLTGSSWRLVRRVRRPCFPGIGPSETPSQPPVLTTPPRLELDLRLDLPRASPSFREAPSRSAAHLPSVRRGEAVDHRRQDHLNVADGVVWAVHANIAPRNTGATMRPPVPKFRRVISMI